MPTPLPGPRERARSLVLRYIPQGVLARPFELYIATLCVAAGAPLLGGSPAPATVEDLLPIWLVRLWGIELIVGATLVAIGVLRPRTRLERMGHSLLGPAAFTYGLCILAVVGSGGKVAAAVTCGFGLACLTRAFVLRTAERLIARMIAEDDR